MVLALCVWHLGRRSLGLVAGRLGMAMDAHLELSAPWLELGNYLGSVAIGEGVDCIITSLLAT